MASKSSSRLRAQRTTQPPSRGRTAGKRVSYRESTSDSNEYDDKSSQEDYEPAPSAPAASSRPSRSSRRRPAPPQSTKPSTKRKALHSKQPLIGTIGAKRKKLNHNQSSSKQKEQHDTMIQMTGKAMPWNTLPYQILCLIFEYASWPLLADDGINSRPSVRWLLDTALCCKTFAEPALSALYYSPPLYRKTSLLSPCDPLSMSGEISPYL